MNFLRLPDSLPAVLFENEDIVAIDKPYGFNAHTNDSKIEHSDFIQDGLIELYEKFLGHRLHIVHRLDQTTTGVMIFGKSVESTKKYADFFFNREVKKTYWFITKYKSTQDSFLIDQTIVHKDRELDAKTQLSFLKKNRGFELWQANPYTGRNHQIRIHAKAANISILGDPKYEGAEFPFLCLHNHKIEFPNGISITSKPPTYFENLDLLEDLVLARALFEADRRQRLFVGANPEQCYRLAHTLNGAKEPGFTIDQFGPVLVLNWHKEYWHEAEEKKFTYFAKVMKRPVLVRLWSEKEKNSPQRTSLILYPEANSPTLSSPWFAKELETKYELKSDAGMSAGLFLDQRLQRQWVLNNSKDRKVLNLFANTCGFGLAAALGNARDVTSVENSKSALNWGRKNFVLNNLDDQKFRFLFRDSFTFLEQCQNKNEKFDLIICDTPAFMKREKKIFKIKNDLEAWLQVCLSCLTPEGELLFSTNFDGFFIQDLRKMILQAQKNLKIQHLQINNILPSVDFELPNEKANLKSFLIRLGKPS